MIDGSGWQTAWNASLGDKAAIIAGVKCDASYQTWTTASDNDRLPMNCVSWYQAFAFCAWDGGRLPTEVEWEYAATGGDAQRLYPWGATALSNAQDSTAAYANYYGMGDGSAPATYAFADILPVGSKPAGVGRYGQLDLAGSMWEWALDWHANPYPASCTNCANLTPATYRVIRGGGWYYNATYVTAIYRYDDDPFYNPYDNGIRCARTVPK